MDQPVEFKVGDIYEDCAYHPVVCGEIDTEEDYICGTSMVDGSGPRNCSLRHCGIRKLTKEEADELVAVWQAEGERGAMRLRGWKQEAIDEFFRKWR